MNSYLSSIAARALNPVPPVRPRLRGRFDAAPRINNAAIDQLEVAPVESIASRRADDIDRRADFENHGSRQAQMNDRPRAAIDPATLTLPQRDSKASSDSKHDTSERPPQSPTIQMPIANANLPKTQPARLISQAEAVPSESLIEHANKFEPAIQTPPVSRGPARDPRDKNEIIPTAVREHNSDAQAQTTFAASVGPAQTSPHSPARRGEDQRVPELLPSRSKPHHEREIKTIVVREQKIIERSAQPRDSNPKQLMVPAVSPSSEPERRPEKRPPVAVQSRIAPLVEKGAESFSPSRPVPQPTVRVTIGRVEVRAVQSSHAPAKPRATTTPVMNLDDYLRRRNQGSAR